MTHLLYIANIRLPTEKAHGLQIMQNCEAFTDHGVTVTLWVARRVNTPEMNAIPNPWDYYGVKRSFALWRVPCIDLMTLAGGQVGILSKLAFLLQLLTFVFAASLRAVSAPADVYYSRDPAVLLVLSLFKPRYKLVYEPHTLAPSAGGRWLQRIVIRRVGTVIPVTPKLRDDLVMLETRNGTIAPSDTISDKRFKPLAQPDGKFLVAHDGIRRERFAYARTQAEARQDIGWSPDALIVGYVGRLQTMAMDKGVGTLIEALCRVDGWSLALVGGPDDIAETLRQHWLSLGLEASRFLYAGHVLPERVPLYLSAFDVCAMPFPWTTHFAYYASPIKLFEYMAARRAIVASDLPSTADVVTHNESALLYPPDDVAALAAALTRLRDDPALRSRLADAAYLRVMTRYTWEARAQAILEQVAKARFLG